jgi:hypothetical protein
VSRRRSRAGSARRPGRPPLGDGGAREAAGPAGAGPARHGGDGLGTGLLRQILLLLGVFAAVTLVADLLGAANLGVALGIGQIGFAVALMYVLVRR